MRLIASLVASTTIAAGAAQAGGYVPPVVDPVPVVVETVAPSDWAGGYAGLTLGYAFRGKDEFGIRDLGNGSLFNAGKLELSGANAGVHVGYRWQKDRWVFGPELGFEGGNIKDDVQFTDESGLTTTGKSKIKNVLALRFKTGYAVRPDLLVYGIAGVARADIDYGVSDTNGTDANLDYKKTGYILGLGAEKKINDKWSVTGEYEYADFGKTDRDFNGNRTVATPKYNNIKVGVNFRF